MCCLQGDVVIPKLREQPPELEQLYTEDNLCGKEFQANICQYNSALAMVSLGVKIDWHVTDGHGPYVFKIQGALHHNAGSLLPAVGEQPSYAQLYLYDSEQALNARMTRNSGLNWHTMAILQGVLYQHNHFVRLYKQAWQIMSTIPPDQEQKLRLIFNPETDQQWFNLPTATEMAAIIPAESNNGTTSYRDIILTHMDGNLERIHEGQPAYQPLHYVLLFPCRELGWHDRIPRSLHNQPNVNVANPDADPEHKKIVLVSGSTMPIDFIPDQMSQILSSVQASCFNNILLMHGQQLISQGCHF
jgi:hypothetical protein